MFGPKRNPRPATRLETGCFGAVFFCLGAFFVWGMGFGERDPSAPKIALVAAFLMALFIALIGGWLLVKSVLWDGDERR